MFLIDERISIWKRAIALLAVLALATVMVACGDDSGSEPSAQETEAEETEAPEEEETPAEEEGAGDITVTAKEYHLDVPPTLPAGPATFTLQNIGKQPHHFILAKLTEDAPPIAKLIKLQKADKFLEEDITGNKPPMAAPGETSEPLEVELEVGTYGYVCFIGDKVKKKPHAFLGMFGSFEVI